MPSICQFCKTLLASLQSFLGPIESIPDRPIGPGFCRPASHRARQIEWSEELGRTPAVTSEDLLWKSLWPSGDKRKNILQTSFGEEYLWERNIFPGKDGNGFLGAALMAYSHHHHLVIRPDDVWITILTQLSSFINANAEELRTMFVEHEGKKEITVVAVGNRYTADFGLLVRQLTTKLENNVKDPSLRKWMLQDFSTTTDHDRAVCAIAMMATLQEYFKYKILLGCGLPSVTLLGTREDWVQLKEALTRLPSLGEPLEENPLSEWSKLLDVVISHFIATFDAPDAEETKEFWQKMAHYTAHGSGTSYLSGWITAFCFWSPKGIDLRKKGIEISSWYADDPSAQLVIDGQVFHKVDTSNLPSGAVSVPVVVDDNGHEIASRMVAGCVAVSAWISGEELDGGGVGLDIVQPEVGWWIFEEDNTSGSQERSWNWWDQFVEKVSVPLI